MKAWRPRARWRIYAAKCDRTLRSQEACTTEPKYSRDSHRDADDDDEDKDNDDNEEEEDNDDDDDDADDDDDD